MEPVDFKERDGIWIPLTPGKSTLPLPSGILDDGHEAVLPLDDHDPKPTKVVQYDTTSVQEATIKVKVPIFFEPDHQSQADVDSISTPSKSNFSKKRRNKDDDLNKKPSQRLRVKKHRPKVYDDSKLKIIPKANTLKRSTPKPKTPKPSTPKRVREASTESTNDVKPCKRFLDFYTLARNRLPMNSVETSDGLFKYSNRQQGEDTYVSNHQEQARDDGERYDYIYQRQKKTKLKVSKYQEQAGDDGERYDYVYQRRNKTKLKVVSHPPVIKVYQRTFRNNNCLQNSRKFQPNFPKMFKKRRRLRKKVCIWKFKCLEKPVKKQRVQITEEKVSGDNKGAVKRRNHEKNRWLVTKNHSVTHSHVRTVNGLSDSVSERKNQNVNGAIVKIAPSKKRKEVPKVDLDEESLRVWKLLMENDGSGPVETDKDKEEWWERQREIFRGRVESFLAKMHLIQGNRRFSRWKGSVTDSVVGAFLTQNVSDHLSSSAFMSVAARFPAKWQISRKKNSKSEKKQEKKTHWEQVRKSNCKTGSTKTDENCMDAVDWDAVRRCTIEELANVIAKRGMNNMLAEKIKDFLDRMYKDHGTLDLEWLRYAPPDVAKEFLLSFDRMGLKSVECIRLLTLHHHAFPVDTNVGRVATRLGWVPLQPLPDALRIHLLNAYPMVDTIQKYLYPRLCTLDQRTLYELHYQLITFGKVFCTKIKPNCNACPMKAECRHYASAVAASRPALPGSVSNVTSITPVGSEQNCSMFSMTTSSSGSSDHVKTCDPIIEVPSSPEPEINDTQPIIGDIEDLCVESDDEIPIIQLNVEEFRETLKNTHNISLPEGDEPKALVALYEESTTFRVARAKFITKLRTFHIVYELPDSHPILAGFDKREDDDPSPYLLRVWHPDELPKSLENTENRASNSCNDDQEETFKGTILIPCRTANRGKFPLNGTYFQVNEVFADYETSHFPIDIPSHMLRKLTTRALGCGLSTTSIFKGLSRGDIMHLFWRGSICVRSFNRKTRQADNLHKRLYMSKTKTIIAAENRKSKR